MGGLTINKAIIRFFRIIGLIYIIIRLYKTVTGGINSNFSLAVNRLIYKPNISGKKKVKNKFLLF